jgi:hypothetical protein
MFASAAGALLGLLAIYWLGSYVYNNYRHSRKAAALGCKPPARRQHHLPFGVDLVNRLVQGDKTRTLPQTLMAIYNELGKETWVQYTLEADIIVTNEPENLKALLATQFSDFELGSQRRGNFFPAFGNGEFVELGPSEHTDMDRYIHFRWKVMVNLTPTHHWMWANST